MLRAEHLHEMHIGASREGGMAFKGRTETLQLNGFHILHGNHHMGIAHAGGRHREGVTFHLQLSLGQAGRSQGQGGGHRRRLEQGRSHVDANGAVSTKFRHDPTRQRLHLPDAAGFVAIAVGQEARQAADAVAAHLRFAAIGIEDPHPQLPPLAGRQCQDHSIATNAKAPVAEATHRLRIQPKGPIAILQIAAIQKQEIITEPLILAELEHRSIPPSDEPILCRASSNTVDPGSTPPPPACATCRT